MATHRILALIPTLVLAATAYGQTFLTNGLVAYFPFNGNANDESGNGRSLANSGAILTADRFGKPTSAYSFDGNSGMLETNSTDSLILFNGCTLSCWVNLVNDNVNYSLVRKDGDASIVIVNSQTKVNSFYVETYGTGPSGPETHSGYAQAPPLGQWCMLTATWDKTNFVQYINGQKTLTTQHNSVSTSPTAPISIGRSPVYDEPLIGKIDDVRVYNRPLSASEVQQLYDFEAPPLNVTDGLVAFYPFNGNANDASGNGINGNSGTCQLVADRFGNPNSAYYFNGTNSFITFPKTPTTNVDNISMFCWVRPAVLPQWGIALKLGFSNGNLPCNGYGLGIGSGATVPSGRLFGENACIAWVDGGFTFNSTTTWHQLGFIRQNGTDYFYVDGQLTSSQKIGTPSPPTDFCIGTLLGSDQNNAIFNGFIDDVRIYVRALTSREVQQLYTYEAGPSIGLLKAVKPVFSNLFVGTNYQLQVSVDMASWTNYGSAFSATNSAMSYPQYFDVDNWNDLFFRLQVTP